MALEAVGVDSEETWLGPQSGALLLLRITAVGYQGCVAP